VVGNSDAHVLRSNTLNPNNPLFAAKQIAMGRKKTNLDSGSGQSQNNKKQVSKRPRASDFFSDGSESQQSQNDGSCSERDASPRKKRERGEKKNYDPKKELDASDYAAGYYDAE